MNISGLYTSMSDVTHENVVFRALLLVVDERTDSSAMTTGSHIATSMQTKLDSEK